jgi:hypothetical protein
MGGIIVFAVWTDAVRGAIHQERIRPAGGIFRHINRCKQAFSVAHRDAELVFGIVGAYIVLRGRARRRLLGSDEVEGKSENGQNGEDMGS